MRVLLIEDERKAAAELKGLIETLRPDWLVAAPLYSVGEAIEWLQTHEAPDLLFSDIQLGDGVCFRIFEKIRVDCPIIFCTAYDEYVLKAFELCSIDYLLKPVDRSRLEKALDKLDHIRELFGKEGAPAGQGVGRDGKEGMVVGKDGGLKTLLVYHQQKIIPVRLADVAYFYYNNGVVTVRLHNGETYYIHQAIDDITADTDGLQFYRANRQFLINRSAVRNMEKFFARKLVVKLHLDTPEPLIVSKARTSDFLHWLKNGG